MWGQLSSLHSWKRESAIAVSDVGEEEKAKKREAGHTSFPVFFGFWGGGGGVSVWGFHFEQGLEF